MRLIATAIVAFLFACLHAGMPSHSSAQAWPTDAIGRLRSGAGLCTAFTVRSERRVTYVRYEWTERVYWRNVLVSAGHCASLEATYEQPAIGNTPKQRVPTYLVGFTSGRPESHGIGHDIAVFIFTTYQEIPVLTPRFGIALEPGAPLLSIGYGNEALMARVGPFLGSTTDGALMIDSWVSSGTSGGPVLIAGTREVVGVVIEGRPRPDDRCIGEKCWWSEITIASSIDRLLGLVRW